MCNVDGAARMNAAQAVRIEDIATHPAFRRLATIGGIEVDLRYAGRDNFEGRVLYQGIDCA